MKQEKAEQRFLIEFSKGSVANYWCHACGNTTLRPVAWGKQKGTVRMQCRRCGRIEYRRHRKN